MADTSIKLEIGDFLGFCDLNGAEALESWQVEKLENYIFQCDKAMKSGVPLVVDAIYDKLVEVLKKSNPDAEILGQLWSEDEVAVESIEDNDIYRHLLEEPMRSIATCKSYDCSELMQFISRLPANDSFDLHGSIKLNGHGIRCVFCYGLHEDSTSRARNSAGHNIKRQLDVILEKMNVLNIEDLTELDNVEIRGELVLPFSKLDKAREFNSDIVSAFTGVSSMLRDSATEEEWGLLEFVAYKIIGDGFVFENKSDEYDLLESLGFKTPMSWTIEGLTKDTILDELQGIMSDCEDEVKPDADGENGYDYYSDGIVIEVNNRDIFNSMGSDGKKYNFGNVAMKVGYWKQDNYYGYIQTILWTRGKSKLSPVAIIADDIETVKFTDYEDHAFISSIKQISNWKELGVLTAGGNKVRRVPLYEPNNMIMLNAFAGELLNFRYGGEAGVIPCFPDGTPLSEGKIKQIFEAQGDDDYWENDMSSDVEDEEEDEEE